MHSFSHVLCVPHCRRKRERVFLPSCSYGVWDQRSRRAGKKWIEANRGHCQWVAFWKFTLFCNVTFVTQFKNQDNHLFQESTAIQTICTSRRRRNSPAAASKDGGSSSDSKVQAGNEFCQWKKTAAIFLGCGGWWLEVWFLTSLTSVFPGPEEGFSQVGCGFLWCLLV